MKKAQDEGPGQEVLDGAFVLMLSAQLVSLVSSIQNLGPLQLFQNQDRHAHALGSWDVSLGKPARTGCLASEGSELRIATFSQPRRRKGRVKAPRPRSTNASRYVQVVGSKEQKADGKEQLTTCRNRGGNSNNMHRTIKL